MKLYNYWNKIKNNLVFLIINMVLKGDVECMAMVYATLIIKGVKTFPQVPSSLKDQVRQILIDLECEHLIVEE